MFLVTWLFDKIGYMPKVSIDTTWPFPATQKEYKPHPDEVQPAKKAVKIPNATTRKPKTK
jgi:hypothetical protein